MHTVCLAISMFTLTYLILKATMHYYFCQEGIREVKKLA